ncbi:MAG: hypothetical protein ABT15_17625 [Pseudonocardia sp. SCN 73-27]|nr:MAG: hypothetical protein ABS80_05040 [Pseudonocardia sp. SCN 72-51]ODV05318.1 MAG: hypothetical protein ABT15_17625 [Pseudonocardia sp. SCN 73-27]
MEDVNESQRSRATARDRGLRRATRTTGIVAVGGVAATALAAVVFAQTPGTDADAAVLDGQPVAGAQATQEPPGPATDDAPAPARHSRSTNHATGGSTTQGLQPPATPVAPPVARHSHATSGAS